MIRWTGLAPWEFEPAAPRSTRAPAAPATLGAPTTFVAATTLGAPAIHEKEASI